MELSKCMGCMEPYAGYPCPRCGYDPAQSKAAEYALPSESILAGKYLIGKVLGQGGYGITYIGWDIALERKVAIKEYYPSGQVSRTPGARNLTWYTSAQSLQARNDGMEMFLKEARKMTKVDKIPGVVRVLDLFRENDTAYIVMDFVEGETLKARLQRQGPLTWEQTQAIFRPAVFAMAKVHKAGLVHRDLSPDNLMLTPDGEVQILDLGAAKDLSINSGASSMQVAKSGFSPWEQYTQRGGSGPWTDVYAMAATVYYSLTGKIPPNAMDRIDSDTISWDLPQLQVLPPASVEALRKALAVRAKDRTQSMEELAQGLFAIPAQSVAQTAAPETAGPAASNKTEAKIRFCGTCGARLNHRQTFCTCCGTKVPTMAVQAADIVQETAAPEKKTGDASAVQQQSGIADNSNDTPSNLKLVWTAFFIAATFVFALVLILNITGGGKTDTQGVGRAYANAKVGDIITFGSYEQDGNLSNGEEAIEWIVLNKWDDRLFVISRNVLDCQPYNKTFRDVAWSSCSLRKWLNKDFYNAAFTDEEKNTIVTTLVTADANPSYDTDAGKDTKDKVFLLSTKAVAQYFPTTASRICDTTAYAVSQGIFQGSGSYASTFWWTRTPGNDPKYAAYVTLSGGFFSKKGYSVHDIYGGIRPAIVLDLSA